MEDEVFKTFEAVCEDNSSKSCVDTGFTLYGDGNYTVNVTHNFLDGLWVAETSVNGKLFTILKFETVDTVIQYLSIKEDTYLPAIGFIYDDLMFIIKSKGEGVFDVSSKVMEHSQLLSDLKELDSIPKIVKETVTK